MNGRDSIQSLLALRKLTRAITDAVRVQMTEYLKTLTPLLRPKAVLGEYVQGGPRESSRKADKAFGDLQALYETVAVAKPYNLPRELNPPLSFTALGLEITPLDYYHVAQAGADTRKIKVRCPLTWVLTYTDFPPTRLQELLDTKARSIEELQRFVLHYLVMHLATTQRSGADAGVRVAALSADDDQVPGIRRAADHPHRDRDRDRASVRRADDRERRADRDGRLRRGRQGGRHRRAARSFKGRLLEIARQQAPELV